MANVLQQIGAVTAMNIRTIPDRLGISMVIVAGIAGVVGVLIAMLAMEAIFGIPGLVAAPVYYAYVKNELSGRGLI